MKYLNLHSWEVSPQEAIKIQKDLKSNISLKKSFNKIAKIAGVDVSYYQNKMIAGVIISKFKNNRKAIFCCFNKLPIYSWTSYFSGRTEYIVSF